VRIVFLNPVGEFGGAERSLLAWMGAVREAFPQAHLSLVLPAEGLLSMRAREAGVSIEVLSIPAALARIGDSALRGKGTLAGRIARAVRLGATVCRAIPAIWTYTHRLRELLNRLQPALIHSNGIKTHLALRLAGRDHLRGDEAPTVWHLHDFIGHRPLVARALRWGSKQVTAAVAVSDAVAANARSTLPAVPISRIYNVVDLTRFSPVSGEGCRLDALSGMEVAPANTVRVVLVATYARWKGQDVLIEAASLIARDPAAPAIRFYIVGGPIYRTSGSQFSQAELEAMAKGLGITDRVGFIPFQKEPAEVYRAADVVVHASKLPEPFGLTILEAMACQRAVIVAAAGGAAELFTNGHDALGVSPGDPQELAGAILRLAHDPDMRIRLGRNARLTVANRFDSGNLATQVKSLYASLLPQSSL
jgi:glycosyltransferase involved in cell wall biosynthesis